MASPVIDLSLNLVNWWISQSDINLIGEEEVKIV